MTSQIKSHANAHAEIARAVREHGVSSIARKLGVCRETLLCYVAEIARSATREQIDNRVDRL